MSVRNGVRGKECTVCDRWLSLENYSKHHVGNGGLRTSCKDCNKKIHADYYVENREKVLEKNNIWSRANVERSIVVKQCRRASNLGLAEDLTVEQWKEALNYFGNRCALSGSNLDLTMDHAISLSTGYSGTTVKNVYPIERRLNSSKSNTDIFTWFNLNHKRFGLQQENFDRLIQYLAEQNGMTTQEYEMYTYECHRKLTDSQ